MITTFAIIQQLGNLTNEIKEGNINRFFIPAKKKIIEWLDAKVEDMDDYETGEELYIAIEGDLNFTNRDRYENCEAYLILYYGIRSLAMIMNGYGITKAGGNDRDNFNVISETDIATIRNDYWNLAKESIDDDPTNDSLRMYVI